MVRIWRNTEGRWKREGRDWAIVVALSTVVHVIFLVVLALFVISVRSDEEIYPTRLAFARDEIPTFEELDVIVPQPKAGKTNDVSTPVEFDIVSPVSSPVKVESDPKPTEVTPEVEDPVGPTVRRSQNLSGRSERTRAALVAQGGGSAASERAVTWGLQWLAKHQASNGGWSFNHLHDGCDEVCDAPGAMNTCTTAPTAMALLAFLGAGHTHEPGGEYSEVVHRGLAFLASEAKIDRKMADLRGVIQGNSGMYSHGLATIALCEAYAMTKDPQLRKLCQESVNFLADAQHSNGGWRYSPREAGDTSVVGWQVMALSSARMGRLAVSQRVRRRASRFLNLVQANEGSHYGYTGPGKQPSTTAIGLLCRIYLGWPADKPELKRGVSFLSTVGPSSSDMYYNYYATQVLHHWGGKEWRQWNAIMRDQLVNSQVDKGHARGSWSPQDRHGSAGGRLYMTCLCVMTLEVYYRHLPLYHRANDAVAGEG